MTSRDRGSRANGDSPARRQGETMRTTTMDRGRITIFILLCSILLGGCGEHELAPGTVLDEAKRVGRAVDSFTAADEDYFRDMDQNKDGAVALTTNEVKGRNSWIVWTGGNDRFWDIIASRSVGALDFLKTLSSHPSLKFSRDNR